MFLEGSGDILYFATLLLDMSGRRLLYVVASPGILGVCN